MGFVQELIYTYQSHASANNAAAMEKYMKYNFQFFGLKTPLRRKLLSELWKKHKTEITENPRDIALELYKLHQRELHLTTVEILIKELKENYLREDKKLIEKMITTNSWWDTVDFLAKYLLGNYLIQFPEERNGLIQKFSDSKNMWLNRSAILFQLSYKENTDQKILFDECNKHKNSKEFFIQKAIGWALREYARIDHFAVENFVMNTSLKPLSKREALKHIKLL